MTNIKPFISLVMCTRNRAPFLNACLESLARQKTDHPFELILVDNGSTDDTPAVLAAFVGRHPELPVVLVSEPQPGVSRGRYAGIRVAQGELIAFTDDDCYPAEDFLSAVAQCFREHDIGYLGGRVLLFDPADLPITIQPLNETVKIAASAYMPPGLIHGANFAFRREVLKRIGGFDIHLGPGTPCMAADDTDLMQRASVAGYAGLYSPTALVHHHHRRKSPEDEQKILRAYAISRGAYFRKGLAHRETRRLFLWPVLRTLGGHFVYRRFETLKQEMHGARTYARMAAGRG